MVEWVAQFLTELTGEHVNDKAALGLIILIAVFILIIIFGRMCNQCAKAEEKAKEAKHRRLNERK